MDAFTQSFYIHKRLIFTISYELNSLVLDDEKTGGTFHYRCYFAILQWDE